MPSPPLKPGGAAPPSSALAEIREVAEWAPSSVNLRLLSGLDPKPPQAALESCESDPAKISQTLVRHLPAKDVCARYRIVLRTLDRWSRDHRLDFPKPLRINQRRYFAEHELFAWEQRQLAKGLVLLADLKGTL